MVADAMIAPGDALFLVPSKSKPRQSVGLTLPARFLAADGVQKQCAAATPPAITTNDALGACEIRQGNSGSEFKNKSETHNWKMNGNDWGVELKTDSLWNPRLYYIQGRMFLVWDTNFQNS